MDLSFTLRWCLSAHQPLPADNPITSLPLRPLITPARPGKKTTGINPHLIAPACVLVIGHPVNPLLRAVTQRVAPKSEKCLRLLKARSVCVTCLSAQGFWTSIQCSCRTRSPWTDSERKPVKAHGNAVYQLNSLMGTRCHCKNWWLWKECLTPHSTVITTTFSGEYTHHTTCRWYCTWE